MNLDKSRKPSVLKITGSFVLLIVVFFLLDVEKVFKITVGARPTYIMVGMALSMALHYVNAWKFKWMLYTYPLSVFRLSTYNMISAFFSIVLPGFISSDIIRVYYIAKDIRDSGKAFASVLINRITGLWGQLFLGIFALIALIGDAGHRPLVLFLGVLALACSVLAGIGLFPVAIHFFEKLNQWAGNKFGVSMIFNSDSRNFFLSLIKNKMAFWLVIMNSLAYNLALGVVFMIAGYSIGIHLSLAQGLILLLFYTISMALPMSVGNWGVSEGVFAVIMALFGEAAEVGVVISLFIRFLNLPGILAGWFLFTKDKISIKQILNDTQTAKHKEGAPKSET